ncbi:helix-turn-helix transcriptional regulator [Pseudomonas turukhanskensis]|uniref:helix-turn-helix transcriptional regulator n=1 Tax=Pseudomonas turukhanskensis TaxID=1806536 RepID=UPI0022F2BA7E|nr:AlpA family phage regulatory protein [Pseudomonas turukhanskensis]
MADKPEVEATTVERHATFLHQAERYTNAHNSISELRIKETSTHAEVVSKTQIIRLSQLTEMLSISRSCVYDWLNPRSPRHDPFFPKQIRLSGRKNGGAVGWRLESIMAWLDSRG